MKLIITLFAALVIFGCIGGATEKTEEISTDLDDVLQSSLGVCVPDYSINELADGTLGKTTKLTATVTCAGGKDIIATVDGKEVLRVSVKDNETTAMDLDVPAVKDGSVELAVTIDDEVLLSETWEVGPLGNTDTSGVGYDAVSFKEWRAVAFDIEGKAEVGRVRVFMKRLEGMIQENTNIVLDIRDDNDGEPGNIDASVKLPISETTLSDNWINFDFDSKITLSKGTYWAVIRIEQTEDVKLVSDTVMVHYIINDREEYGNDYTRQMRLEVDEKLGFASETEWEPLPYDKVYNVVLRYE